MTDHAGTDVNEHSGPSSGSCVNCKEKREGRRYSFHYGSEGRTSFKDAPIFSGADTIYTTEILIAGEASAFVCDRCIRDEKLKMLRDALKIAGGLTAAAGVFFIIFVFSRLEAFWGFAIFSLALLGLLILAAPFVLADELDELGNTIAMRAKQAEFEKRGYPELFGPKRYSELKPPERTRPGPGLFD